MLKVIAMLFTIGAIFFSTKSYGTTDDGIAWATCSTCTTRDDFIAAGQAFYSSRPQQPHVMNLNVGNPDTGKVYYMQIVGNVGGGVGNPVPALDPQQAIFNKTL